MFYHYILGLDLYVSIFLGGSHRVLHTWDARWRLRGRKIRQKFGACWRRLTRRRRNLDSKKIKKMGRSCLVLQRVLHEIIANLKRKSESAMGNMINHDQPTICWTCPIFRGCFICAMQQRYGGSCLFNQTKWSKMSMFNTSCNVDLHQNHGPFQAHKTMGR
jgi:hypothetical protein